jgi:hypothetical protein
MLALAGLMVTAMVAQRIMYFFNFTMNIRNTCVFLAPFMAGVTSMSAYLLVKEVRRLHRVVLQRCGCLPVIPPLLPRSLPLTLCCPE